MMLYHANACNRSAKVEKRNKEAGSVETAKGCVRVQLPMAIASPLLDMESGLVMSTMRTCRTVGSASYRAGTCGRCHLRSEQS